MHFVGIFADSDDYDFLIKELNKEKEYAKIQLLNLNEDNIENMRNIKFETIVISTDMKNLSNKQRIINNILKDSKYLLINSDINTLIGKLKNSKIQTITYGMNQKATVTTSSVREDEILICLQRSIKNINGDVIEMQEFKINADNVTNKKVYNLIVLSTIKLLYPNSKN